MFAHLANEQVLPVKQILFCGTMVPTLLPVRPGLHSMDAGLLWVCHCHCLRRMDGETLTRTCMDFTLHGYHQIALKPGGALILATHNDVDEHVGLVAEASAVSAVSVSRETHMPRRQGYTVTC